MFPSKAQALQWGVNDWEGVVSLTAIEGLDPTWSAPMTSGASSAAKEMGGAAGSRTGCCCKWSTTAPTPCVQVLKLDSGRALGYDKTNQLHLAAVAMGRAKLERCPVAVIRESWFVGPHHLVDRPALLPTTCTRWCRSGGIAKTAPANPMG